MSSELEEALASLEALAKRGRPPTRHDARPLLLEIGRLLAGGSHEGLVAARGRIDALPSPSAEALTLAVQDEISMAATEFVCSADPRYIGHPKYDWAYTLEARELLGWRLEAVQFLGIQFDPGILAGIDRADRLLEERRPDRRPVPKDSGADVRDSSKSQ